MFSETIHTVPVTIFVSFTAALVVGVVAGWIVTGIRWLKDRQSVSYKRSPYLLTGLYVLSALAVIFTLYAAQQTFTGCVDVSKSARADEPCYDLNEWNWGWLGILLSAGVVAFALAILAFSFRPFKRK